MNSSSSNLTFHLDKELSCRNFVILNHYRKESVVHHLKHARGQARNLFLQVLLFGQEVKRDQTTEEEAIRILKQRFP